MDKLLARVRDAVAWLGGRTGRRAYRSFRVRIAVQSGFALACVLIGIQFVRFYRAAAAGTLPLPTRPPGVEGFLPISGLMGLVDWSREGRLNTIHPAATALLLVALALALLLRRSFCSWVCPVGLLSDLLTRLERQAFGRSFRPWRWLDIPLRGLKYALLVFFLWAILTMSEPALEAFIHSPYNQIADVKMGLYFVHLSETAGIVLALLVLGSVFIRGFWCRYLCPYGALLGLFSRYSPVRVTRDARACVDCSLCDRACMARLPVSSLDSVRSVECTGCFDCVAACPIEGVLTVRVGHRRLRSVAYGVAVIFLFLAGYAAARLSGSWRSSIDDSTYVHFINNVDAGTYGHPGEGKREYVR